jgi:uncharacterized damage-inducible protein DinB
MFTSINDFLSDYQNEREGTLKILSALTDASLTQSVASDHRTIGRIAWHLVTSYPEMMGRVGLVLNKVGDHDTIPATSKNIHDSYAAVSEQLIEQVKAKWNDATLANVVDMYGEKWKNGFTLEVLIRHEIHHRAQMTVLMRQAGLKVPGVYGPAYEEWSAFGANPPVV